MLGNVSYAKSGSSQIYLFIAPGFEEAFVTTCLVTMRRAGLRIALVGTIPGEIVGANGVCLRPDYALDALKQPASSGLMIIPGGMRCVQALSIDPRFHQVMQSLMAAQGTLILSHEAQLTFRQEQAWPFFLNSKRVLTQEELSQEDFFLLLIRLVKVGEFLSKRLE
ncbi:MAG: DJ-1/PfpI family protein [Anaerolineales bacterium]|nr:DJ-1/PfpI family protein [Anaerolineales bacterium]